MVFLAITPGGLAESIRMAAGTEAVWCGSDAISEAEFQALAATNLTRFSSALGEATPDKISEFVVTVQEHHPGQRVWVEHVGS